MDKRIRRAIWAAIAIMLSALFAFGFLSLCYAGETEELQWQLAYWKEVKNRATIEAAYASKMIFELERTIKKIQEEKVSIDTTEPQPEE